MRPIKFRAWETGQKRMFYDGPIVGLVAWLFLYGSLWGC